MYIKIQLWAYTCVTHRVASASGTRRHVQTRGDMRAEISGEREGVIRHSPLFCESTRESRLMDTRRLARYSRRNRGSVVVCPSLSRPRSCASARRMCSMRAICPAMHYHYVARYFVDGTACALSYLLGATLNPGVRHVSGVYSRCV